MKKLIITESQYKRLISEMVISEMTVSEVDDACKNVNLTPTEAQKEAGNYSMGHIYIKGMKIAIENPKGSKRYYGKKDENGHRKYNVMKNHYGYFNISKGKDGDAVDVFLGPDIEDFERVYCIDQRNKDGEFDETKVMLGFNSKEEAKSAYLSNYEPNWKGFMAITSVGIKTFKKWLYRGRKQRQPFKDYVEIKKKELKENILKENSGAIEIYYHGGDLKDNLWYNGVLWLTPQDYYAKVYAEHKEKPIIWEVKVDESKINAASLYEFGDDFDPYYPDKETIQEIVKEGYNAYYMDYDSYDAEGLCLLSKEPIVSIRQLAEEEYNLIEDWEE